MNVAFQLDIVLYIHAVDGTCATVRVGIPGLLVDTEGRWRGQQPYKGWHFTAWDEENN